MTTMVTRTICTKHTFKASVGRAVQFALEYYECPTCVAIADREYQKQQDRALVRDEAAALRAHPSICLCSACSSWVENEDEFYRMLEEEAARQFGIELLSPNYCDHRTLEFFGCARPNCPHPGCLDEQAKEPPF